MCCCHTCIMGRGGRDSFSSPHAFRATDGTTIATPIFSRLCHAALHFTIDIASVKTKTPSAVTVSCTPISTPSRARRDVLMGSRILALKSRCVYILAKLARKAACGCALTIDGNTKRAARRNAFAALDSATSTTFCCARGRNNASSNAD